MKSCTNEQVIPNVLKGLHALIRRHDRQAIIETLYDRKVFSERKEIDMSHEEQRTYAIPKIAFFHKFGRWPTLKEAIEFDKTLDVEPLIKESEE